MTTMTMPESIAEQQREYDARQAALNLPEVPIPLDDEAEPNGLAELAELAPVIETPAPAIESPSLETFIPEQAEPEPLTIQALVANTVRDQANGYRQSTESARVEYQQILARALNPQPGDGARLLAVAKMLEITPETVMADAERFTHLARIDKREAEVNAEVAAVAEQRELLEHQIADLRALADAGADVHILRRMNAVLLTFALHHLRTEFRSVAECALRMSGWRLTDGFGTRAKKNPDGTERLEIATAALKRQLIDDLNTPVGLTMLQTLANAPTKSGGLKSLVLDAKTLRPSDLK